MIKTMKQIAILLALLLTGCHIDKWLLSTEAAKGPCGPTGVSCKPYDGTNTCCPSYTPICRPNNTCAATAYEMGAGDAGVSVPRTPAETE